MRREIKTVVAGGVGFALGLGLMHEANMPPHIEARGYEEPSQMTCAANFTATVNVSANVYSFALSEIPMKPILPETSLRPLKIHPCFSFNLRDNSAGDIARDFATPRSDSPAVMRRRTATRSSD